MENFKENLYCIDDFSKEVTVSYVAKSAVIDIKRIYNIKGSVSQTTLNNYIIAFRQFFNYLTNFGGGKQSHYGVPVDEGHLPYYLNKIKKAF